uniref:C2H2-type domain-containing protein n=1 Tax=Plectus sambesii TaxID=2011161 RepID=A0A914VPB1_9BILA
MEDLNACAQCGFTTQNFAEFIEHVDEHEVEHQRQQQPDWHAVGDDESVGSPPCSSSPILKSPKPAGKAKTRQSRKTMHSCPHCNFTTYMSQHMKSHLEAHSRHEGQMYQCDVCQMQFSQKANMHRHRMRHSGVKPYQCRYCLKRFFRKDQMQEHSMTHIKTGADFDCPVASCEMQFSQHAALRSHLEEYHTIAPNSPASCKRCALLFANARRLLLHYQTKHDSDDMGAASPASATSSSRSSRKKALDSPSMVQIVASQDRDSPFQTSSSTPALPVLAGDSQGSEDGTHNAMLDDSRNQSLMVGP